MWGTRRRMFKCHLTGALVAGICLIAFCEFLIHYIVLRQCEWPSLDPQKADVNIAAPTRDEKPVKAMFITDIHLLGSRKGYWLDKHLREWQMYRTFQIAMALHRPEFVFVLGDSFDEGLWAGSEEFDTYIQKFNSLFAVPQNSEIHTLGGNHDMGFHPEITPDLNQRFVDAMKAPSIDRMTIRGNHFVLVNSMALEGDDCFLCKPAEVALNKIGEDLKCAKEIGECNLKLIGRYSRPILLQHFPMYRESDALCDEPDGPSEEDKAVKFKENYECLSKNASEQLLDILNPRLIVDGHIHDGCRRMHGDDTLEVTVPSFNWRNKNNPSFLMAVFVPDNYAISKCYMVKASTVIYIYSFSGLLIIIYLFIKGRKKMRRRNFFEP